MAKFNDKISTILNSQLPEFVVADHPKFAQFLKTYYQLLESAELSIDTIEGTDGILLQSETGQITLNSLNIASISNIRGATSTVVELTVTPNSNDVVPVRDQIVEIDIANSTINVTADTFVGGSADAGVGYTTTSSY